MRVRRDRSAGYLAAGALALLIALASGKGAIAQADDPTEIDDLPGFGIWGPAYRLHNVPNGQRLVLRRAPSRQADILGSLSRSASEILVLMCTPQIDPLTYEDASRESKHRLLAGGWCRIEHAGVEGYVPGVYLDPILGR
ncbi:MAG: hypothetical protein AAGL24_16085 [Pseudomonadota bacterium]